MGTMWDRTVKSRLNEIATWLSLGDSLNAISERLNISPLQLKRYKIQHPELGQIFENHAISHYQSHIVENLETVQQLASEGQTDEFIKNELGIGSKMFEALKDSEPEFYDAIARGHAKLHKRCFKALVKAAEGGYKIVETTYKFEGREKIKVKEVVKIAPPDPTAAINALKMKFARLYRDNSYVSVEAVKIVDDID